MRGELKVGECLPSAPAFEHVLCLAVVLRVTSEIRLSALNKCLTMIGKTVSVAAHIAGQGTRVLQTMLLTDTKIVTARRRFEPW